MEELAKWAAKLFPVVFGLFDKIMEIRKATETQYPDVWKDVSVPGYTSASDGYAKKMAGE